MKPINEYPTPVTDFVFAGWIESHPAKTSHAKLERKLAACRGALQELEGCFECCQCAETAEQTLAATAP